MILVVLAVLCLQLMGLSAKAAVSQPWQKYIYSPESRRPAPVAVHSTVGDAYVNGGEKGAFVLTMRAGSRVSMDFGIEVGGHVSFHIDSKSSNPVSLAFAESPSFVRNISDDTGATPTMDWDQAYTITLDSQATRPVFYKTPKERFRGGFRFLTINALSDATIRHIHCEIGFAPNMPDLRSGSGYFYTSDPGSEILNRIWYAGAYTVQTNMAPVNTGRFLPQVRPGWAYNATLGVASPTLVDGAKRDRAVWPGDMGIEGPVAMMAFGAPGREAFANSLATLFRYQNATTGLLPFAGPATASFSSGSKSDTYHSWGLIAMYEYAIYSADSDWVSLHWSNISAAADYIVNNIDPQVGLQNQTNENDWARVDTGGYNSALNALDYHALMSWASLSPDQSKAKSWKTVANRLKRQFNALLWDESAGLYQDNTMSTLHPQDGNAIALLYGLTEHKSQAATISTALERNWNHIGPVTPELNDTISPFISSIELLAHLHGADNPTRALALLRRLWGFLLDDSAMTGSTLVEGITANGSLYYRSERGYNYDAAYTSLSHGWSTGPSIALITGVLGLRLTEPGGRRWELKPQMGDLRHAQAGFETGNGWWEVEVKILSKGLIKINLTTPPGTKGSVVVPKSHNQVVINNKAHAWSERIAV